MNNFGQRIWGFGVGVAICALILGSTGYFSNLGRLCNGVILFLTNSVIWYFWIFGGTRFTSGYKKIL